VTQSINDAIRRAAGRELVAAQPEPDAPPRFGSIGIGRGGGSAARPRPASTNAEINRRLRLGARIVRDVSLRDGVTIGDFDLWG
jgi:hypothetical protein